MTRLVVLLLMLSCSATVFSYTKSYHGYSVLRTQKLDVQKATLLSHISHGQDVDFWTDPRPGRQADIMASPQSLPDLMDLLSANNIAFYTLIPDVERTLRSSSRLVRPSNRNGHSNYSLTWDDYHSHKDINEFLDSLASTYSWVNTVSIGKTLENRDMKVIQITKAGPGKPNVYIEAGIHAREWISNAVCTYIIKELVENYEQNSDFVDNINFHILPMVNPDGYEFSRSDDRLWRKNRGVNAGSTCKGVDLNRNFGYKWGGLGVSHLPCSEIYCGSGPFSEHESLNIKHFLEGLDPVPILSHAIHSYSQLWLWPYGFDYTSKPDNWPEIKALAESAVIAVKEVNGVEYEPLNSGDFYPASGASDDWYRGGLGSRFSFTTELRDTGNYGFLLPPDQIIPTSLEIMAGLRVEFATVLELSKEH